MATKMEAGRTTMTGPTNANKKSGLVQLQKAKDALASVYKAHFRPMNPVYSIQELELAERIMQELNQLMSSMNR